MASNLETKLSIDVDKSSANRAKSEVDGIKKSVSGLGPVFDGLSKKLGGLGTSIKFAAIGTNLQNAFGAVGNIFGTIKKDIASTFDFVDGFANKADKIAKTSRLVGLSVEDFQAFDSAAKHAGLSTEEMTKAFEKLNVNLGKARAGDRGAMKPFEALLPKNLSQYSSNTEVITALADSYAKLSSAEQKAFVSQELFGRGGIKMAEVLSGGSEGVTKMLNAFKESGAGITSEEAANAENYVDQFQVLAETFDRVKSTVAAGLVPSFIKMFDAITKGFNKNSGKIKEVMGKVTERFADVIVSIAGKLPSIFNMADKIFGIIGPTGTAIVAIGAAIAPLLPPVAMLVTSFMGLLPVIKGIGVAVAALASPVTGTIGLIVAGVAGWVYTIKKVHDNWDMLASAIKESSVGQWFSSAKDSFKAFGSEILGFWGGVASSIWQSLVNAFKGAVDYGKGILKSIPIVGSFFGGEESGTPATGNMAPAVSGANTSTTTTHRFSVDFTNMPRGVQVTPPKSGDFDYSRGYMLGGGV